jgi:hypothetical protein
MKSKTLRLAGVALALAALCGQAVAAGNWGHGGGYHGGGYHGYRGGYHGHYYRGGWGNGWVVGGALGLLAAGTYIALNSGPAYVDPPVVYGGGYAPVYSGPPVYASPPEYAPPPPQYDSPRVANNDYAGGADMIAYPARGQSANQQARDRSQCENWSMNQSGYNPAHVTQYTTPVMADSYNRSMGACMSGRGYSLN